MDNGDGSAQNGEPANNGPVIDGGRTEGRAVK